jgi:hypothetical protein
LKLKELLFFIGQIETSELISQWPDDPAHPRFLRSVYTSGNMLQLLRFILASAQTGQLHVATAHCDYAHAKLLQILARGCSSTRIVSRTTSHEVLEELQSLYPATRLRHNLHCRVILGKQHAAISSADLGGVSYASHLEAGVAIERNLVDPQDFVDEVWDGGIPISQFGIGLSQMPYQTTHILIGLKLTRRQTGPRNELFREVLDETYALIHTYGASGYLSDDRERSMIYVNLIDPTESLRREITTFCTLDFGNYLTIIPIHEVLDAPERFRRTQEVVREISGNITLLYFSTGTHEDIKQRAQAVAQSATLRNPSVRVVAISVESGKALDAVNLPTRTDEQYLCLVHLKGLVALSNPLSTFELEQLSISRYLREASGVE